MEDTFSQDHHVDGMTDFDDQAGWKILHVRHYPDIKVDTLTNLFVRVGAGVVTGEYGSI